MKKGPRVICHMATSIDGRIAGGWPNAVAAAVRREYELLHASHDAEHRQSGVRWLPYRLAAANG